MRIQYDLNVFRYIVNHVNMSLASCDAVYINCFCRTAPLNCSICLAGSHINLIALIILLNPLANSFHHAGGRRATRPRACPCCDCNQHS